jgi:subtilase family serine protease
MRLNLSRRTGVILGAGLLVIPIAVGGSAAYAGTGRSTVPGAVPGWARSSAAVGAPASTDTISFNVALPLRQATTAENLVESLTTPGAANYGKYLTADQFNAKFAPTAASVARVKDFLASAGLTVTGVAAGNRWVSAKGSTAKVNAAFGTVLKTYTYQGHKLRAPSSDVTVPATVAGDVLAVSGLSQTIAKPNVVLPNDTIATGKTAAAAAATSPCSTYWNQYQQTMPEAYGKTSFPTYICGYTPSQLRSAYGVSQNVTAGQSGHGVKVGIIDAYSSPTMLADANAYAAAVGDSAFAPGQYTETIFGPADMQDVCGDWSVEEALDVESVHGMAPGAQVHYFGASNCDNGIDDAVNYIVQHHSVDLVSNSYGWGGEELTSDEINLEHSLYLQAALEGIGFYFSSGDWGDDATIDGVNAPEPSYASSDPLVTGVGGTSLAVDSKGKYLFETGWGDMRDFVDSTGAAYSEPLPGEFYAGAGGGVSTLFKEPFYQKGKVPASLAKSRGGAAMRVDPDISALADPYTGFLFGYTVGGVFTLGGVGGTSLACPLIAGMQADASTYRHFPIGFANPLFYAAGDYLFRDITPTKSPVAVTRRQGTALVTFDIDTTLATTRGYDDVTGLGTPYGARLLQVEGAGW